MATILVICRSCGDIDLPSKHVTLHLGGADGDHFTFDCPDCGHRNRKRAEEHTVDLLRAVGVTTIHHAPIDDTVTRFANQLADDDRLAAELEQLGRQ